MKNYKSILIVINDQNFYLSHRKYIYRKFDQYKIYCLCFKKITKTKIGNINFLSLETDLYSMNLISLLKVSKSILRVAKSLKIDLIHVYGIRPILFSTYLIFQNKKVLMTFTGLGLLNSSRRMIDKLIFFFIKFIIKLLNLSNNLYFNFQYTLKKFTKNIEFKSTSLEEKEFKKKTNYNQDIKNIIVISRILKSKGLMKLLNYSYHNPKIKFTILGKFDLSHPDSLSNKQLNQLKSRKNIKYFGYKKNIKNYISNSDALLFLSNYGEGIPRILLEAGALTIPIITEENCNFPINFKKFIFFVKEYNLSIFNNNFFNDKKNKINQFYMYIYKNFSEDNVYKFNNKIYKKLLNN